MTLLDQCRALLGPAGVLQNEAIDARRWTDDSGHTGAVPSVVLRPATTGQVADVLRLCQNARQHLVVQGGLTGLTDAALPHAGEWVLSLERMTRVAAADPDRMTLVAEGGATLQAVHAAAEAAGLMYGVDIGARGTCTIGGTIAVNAGGNRVLRYGMTRANVLGLEAVLPDGSMMSTMAGLPKDNTGYSLQNLLIGAEGTLGVVTQARLKLHPKPKGRSAAFCACADTAAAIAFLTHLRRYVGARLDAFEAMWGDFYGFVLDADAQIRPPLRRGAGLYLLVEIAGEAPDADHALFEDAVMAAIDDGLVGDAVVAQSLADIAAFWQVREGIYGAARAMEPYLGYDVSVPLDCMDTFLVDGLAAIRERWRDATTVVFGHLGDGNLHVLVGVGDDQPATLKALSTIVYGAVQASGGSISAEHGIGMIKKPYLGLTRSVGEIDAMRRIRSALDPAGILNHGRIF